MQSINDEQNRQHLSSIDSARLQAIKALKILGKGFKAAILFKEDDGSHTFNPDKQIGYVIYADSDQLRSGYENDICPDTYSHNGVLEIVTADGGE